MRTYLLRNIPDDLWIRVKRRAAREGRPLRFVIVKLLERYARDGWNGNEPHPDTFHTHPKA